MTRCTACAWGLRSALALVLLGGCGDEGPGGTLDAGLHSDGPEVPQPPPIGIACEQLDELQRECLGACTLTWDCRASYPKLAANEQLALESCSDCLIASREEGVCADCADSAASVPSCQAFVEQLLAVDCF